MGPRPRPDPGDSSGIWKWANVDEVGAASVARVKVVCVDFGVRMGLGAQSGTMVVLGCGLGSRVRFEDTGSGAWVRFVSTGSGKGVWFVGTGIEAWVRFVGTGIEV